MTHPAEGSLLDRFFQDLHAAPARVLLLDYDGTLAPFRVERDHAVPYDGVRDALRAILSSGHTRVVVISGRAIGDLRRLLAVEPPPELWGTHGWERLERGGPHRLREVPPLSREGLDRALRAVRIPLIPEDRIETKHASVAVHVRGLPREDEARILTAGREAWGPIAAACGLAIHPFDGGLEVRVKGWDKGDAVRAVLGDERHGTAAAFLGDDLTDEDAFAALDGLAEAQRIRALSVLVRGERRESRAPVWLRPPEQLLWFLDLWNRSAR